MELLNVVPAGAMDFPLYSLPAAANTVASLFAWLVAALAAAVGLWRMRAVGSSSKAPGSGDRSSTLVENKQPLQAVSSPAADESRPRLAEPVEPASPMSEPSSPSKVRFTAYYGGAGADAGDDGVVDGVRKCADRDDDDDSGAVCSQSLSVPPELNPNYRCNTSLLIDYCQDEGAHKYIIIDVGKTFREQVLRWFVCHKIPCVDSIILTHEHADAILGLDDVRVVQPFSPSNDIDPTPIYLSQYAMDSISQKFPYLVKKKLKEGEEVRRVAQLDWRIIESDLQKPFTASGLQFVPLPVIHGEDYICLGFLFGIKSKVAYVSDVSRFPPSTEDAISKSGGGQLDLLILDCLYRTGSHNVHLCWDQTLDAIKRICPKKALLIGLTHEMDHHKDNQTLEEWSRREGIDVQLARDGLRVYIDL